MTDTKSWNDLADLESNNTNADTANNLLIIDGNNISYRYLRRANYNSYSSDYIRTVTSLGKSYEAKRTIVAFDFGKSYYRMGMYPEYKGNRSEPANEEEAKRKEEFFAVLNALPDELPCEVAKYRGLEADDIITYLVLKLKSQYDHIWVVSSDKDLLQLLDTNVSIFNLFSRKEITINSLAEETSITPQEYMLSRVIEGDSGDNIIGVEGIGPKRAQAIAKDYKTIENLLKNLPLKGKAKYIQNLNTSKDKLILNEKLINLAKYNSLAIEASKDDNALASLLQF